MPPQSRPRQTQRPSQGPEASVCQMQDLPERVLQDARIATEQPLMVSPQVARLTKDLGYCRWAPSTQKTGWLPRSSDKTA